MYAEEVLLTCRPRNCPDHCPSRTLRRNCGKSQPGLSLVSGKEVPDSDESRSILGRFGSKIKIQLRSA